jgi:hypothetical protein
MREESQKGAQLAPIQGRLLRAAKMNRVSTQVSLLLRNGLNIVSRSFNTSLLCPRCRRQWIAWKTTQSMSPYPSDIAPFASSTTKTFSKHGLLSKWSVSLGTHRLTPVSHPSHVNSLPRVSFNSNESVDAILKAIGGENYIDPLYSPPPPSFCNCNSY